MPSQKSAFQVPWTNATPSAQPFKMPKALFGLSDMSSLKLIGVWKTFTPLARAALTSAVLFSDICSLLPRQKGPRSIPTCPFSFGKAPTRGPAILPLSPNGNKRVHRVRRGAWLVHPCGVPQLAS